MDGQIALQRPLIEIHFELVEQLVDNDFVARDHGKVEGGEAAVLVVVAYHLVLELLLVLEQPAYGLNYLI